VLVTNLRQLGRQVTEWYYQLQIDLAHLVQPDPFITASNDQGSLIAMRTRSHDPPPYGTWYQHRR
jgi:hypothetical protein